MLFIYNMFSWSFRFFVLKKPPPLRISSQGREQLLRVTTLNSLISHDISLINYGREMIHR